MSCFVVKCLNCDKKNLYEICTDNTRICDSCNHPNKGINSYRTYNERIKYYQDALLECTKYNKMILVPACLIIAEFCSDPPRFVVNGMIDYFNSSKGHYVATKVLEIKYKLFEEISIKDPNSSNKSKIIWINAYDKNIEELNIFQPNDTRDCVNISCGRCHCVLYESLTAFQYVIGEKTQPHFSYELFTDIEPKKDNIMAIDANGTKINCKNNCHKPLWLIDHGTGYINCNGYNYALACGRTYAVVQINKHAAKTK